MNDLLHRISPGSLRNRGYVTTSGRGRTWQAEITAAGRQFLVRLDGPNPPKLRYPNRSTGDKLIDELLAANGTLPFPRPDRHDPEDEDCGQHARLLTRRRRVPYGNRLEVVEHGDEVQIDLVDDPTHQPPRSISVPESVGRLHRVARELRDQPERHDVTRNYIERVVHLVHARVAEAELLGHTVHTATSQRDPRDNGQLHWSSTKHGHLTISVRGHECNLRIFEHGLPNRSWFWAQHQGWGKPTKADKQIRDEWEAKSTGRLTMEIVSWGGHGRTSKWSDQRGRSLDDQLGDVLWEIEHRATDDEEQRAEAERRALARRQHWQRAMQTAQQRHATQHRSTALTDQIERWRQARAIRDYCRAMLDKWPDDPDTAEWAQWASKHAASIDPLSQPPHTPRAPAALPDELRPFLDGLSPYGADL